jgi:hypothetical protein
MLPLIAFGVAKRIEKSSILDRFRGYVNEMKYKDDISSLAESSRFLNRLREVRCCCP